MSFPRLIAYVGCLCLLQSYCYAQEKSKAIFGKVGLEDFVLPSTPIIDSNANAVILSDIGSVHCIGNKSGWFSYVYKRQTRIKILNKKAFDRATVRIPLHIDGDDAEKADKVEGATYNLEGGQVIGTKLGRNELFGDKKNKYYIEEKFTMPAVKEGSIIEYTYTITSNFIFNLPTWEFQSEEYPCLWSEYNIDIPQTLSYVFTRHGVHKFAIDKGRDGHGSYQVTEKGESGALISPDKDLIVSVNTIIHQWVMKDIPAFHVENYISSPSNYTDRIEFQLSATYNGEDKRDVMNTWAKANESLLKKEDFGGALSADNDWLNPIVDKAAGDATGPMEQAKAIYYYVNGHVTATSFGRYITTSLQDVVKKNSGSVSDVNLLLVAMLKKKGIPADPVLLSTRGHGFSSAAYPVMDRYNYLIVRTKIGGKVYYLDAASRQLGFGHLAGFCYNGPARIISERDSGTVYFWADSLKEQKMTMVMMMNGEKGDIEGVYQSTLGHMESYNARERIARIGEKEYFKRIQASYGEDLTISATGIDSLNRWEDPVKVHYEFKLNHSADPSLIYFNPLFADAMTENPLKAAERQYPVEMDYAMDNVYVLNMEIPAGYDVDELPKSARVAYNSDQGIFEYLIAKQGSTIQLRCRLKLNRADFTSEDYPSLREFFAFVVKKESETIVLKKRP